MDSNAENAPEIDLSLKIAKGFCAETEGILYCLEEDCFYMYEKGVYGKIYTREMQSIVLTKKSLTRKLTLQRLNNVIDRIATIRQCHVDVLNKDAYINFENGLFDLKDCLLKPHSHKVISTIRIPYEYYSSASSPLWEKTINEIVENDQSKVSTVQEFFGYCLTRDVSQEKALIITGEGANGKSTILNTLKHLVGLENCSALSLRYFSDPQKTSVLKGKLVNICNEVPKKIEDYEAEFKTIVTGEDLVISPKYVRDYTISPFCKLIMAVNEFPYIDDKTSAFYRRLLIIDLKRQFLEEEQDKDLREKLLKELPGIFNWAIEGLKNLRKRGKFLIDENMKQSIESIREMNNPTVQWAKENIIVIPQDELVKGDAFAEYKKWCEKSGYRPCGLNKFGQEVFRFFQPQTEKARRQGHGSREWYWPHLALRTPENELRAEQHKNKINVDWQE